MALTLSAALPATRVHDVVEIIHGVQVHDPFRWLEDGESAEVRAWTAAQNQYLRERLDPVPGRPWLEKRLSEWQETGSLGTPVARGKGTHARLFYTRRAGKQNQPILFVRDGQEGGKDRALLDVNALAADGTAALDWWYPSEDGAWLAYGISIAGDENSTLRVREVATGRDLGDTIPRTRACSLAWLPSGHGFYYTRYPAPTSVPAGEEHYHRSVFFHRLGADPAADPKVFGDGLSLSAWTNVMLSPNGRWLGIEVSLGWSKSELLVADREQTRAPVVMVEGRDAIFNLVDMLDDRFLVVSNEGAPHYQLWQVDPKRPERAHWKLLIAEGDDTLESVTAAKDALVALYLKDASSRVRVFSSAGGSAVITSSRAEAGRSLSITTLRTPRRAVRRKMGQRRCRSVDRHAAPLRGGYRPRCSRARCWACCTC